MQHHVESLASEPELAAVAIVLALACIGGAIWARTRAPAVTIALTTGVLTGGAAFWIASSDDLRGVPLVVLASASAAMTSSGFVALWFLAVNRKSDSLLGVGIVALALAPLAGLATLLAVQHACPLYVTRGAGACFYEDDVLGGWSSAAALVVTLDVVVIAMLLLITDRRASRVDDDAAREALASR